jgi:hypothetical protein
MRILAVGLAAMLLATGCGGGKKTTFTNRNYQTLVGHPTKYAGAHVDVDGQIASVAHDEKGALWLLVYVDAKHASQATLVDVPAGAGDLSERQLVHVVGTVKQDLTVPFDLGGYETAPVVLAETVSPATS